MPQDFTQDLAAIKEWLAKEPHLPHDFEDLMLRKFLHSCYGSLERTKKCIERFCTTRTSMTEVYTDRDPVSPRLQTAFSLASVGTYKAGENEVLIHRLETSSYENLVFFDLLKTFSIQADHWLKAIDFFPEGHIIIFDLKYITLKIIPKVNIMYFRDFLLYLLEGMPVRVKQVHAVNSPSYYEKLYALVKPILPQNIRDIMYFHSSYESLYKYVDKEYLPEEYGGDAQSVKEQHKNWVQKYEEPEFRKWYSNNSHWKADLKKKPRGSIVESTMSGSFRTLSID